ncbi:hypothetical protein TG4357_03108 [Thalassovita gelatinovora]|uniref:Recombinase XerC n=2 Tax=Thalassovita gelatinovora TaxID=53501 RepID=A0A0N7LVY8_THAGE|nr:hypothetical protein TG4357_03108 [Thalassovita gelatinovora]SEP70777.1 hypothetical protein SAMN04488043_101152 [Thalassovita gelatinovora]
MNDGPMSKPKINDQLREQIISQPDVILDDQDLMHALIAANERAMGGNIVDLRGIAMERLESRLDRLEDTHRSVIAAAYENLAGTNQVNRAILRMLDPMEFEVFLRDLAGPVADILRVDCVKLVLESVQNDEEPAVQRLGDVLSVAEPGFIADYLTQGRNIPLRQVTLRQIQDGAPEIYGDKADWMRSEACLKLDFGAGRLPGMLVMGAEDPHQFSPQQGTDLLAFFAAVFERSMRRWLS